MADPGTGPDTITKFLTGAASDGGAQADPDAALGNYRSSTKVEEIAVSEVVSPIANVTIDSAAGYNGPGDGTLTASGVDELTWTPPGGTPGAAVTILNGETKVLEGPAGSQEKYIIVSRTTAVDLTGSATVTLSDVANNVIALDNISTVEAAAGSNKYRAIMLKNNSAASVDVELWLSVNGTQQTSDSGQLPASGAGSAQTSGSFSDWDDSGFAFIENAGVLREIVYYSSRTASELIVPAAGRGALGTSESAGAGTDIIYPIPGLRIAPEAAVADQIQTIANEDTSPTGRTWNTSVDATNGISATIAAGELLGIWIDREVVAGTVPDPLILNNITMLSNI